MKKVVTLIVCLICVAAGIYLMMDGLSGIIGDKNENIDTTIETKTLINPGEVFEKGSYIDANGVEILYNGKSFLIKNNGSNLVRVYCSVVGVKKDGAYERIQLAGFDGVDKTQYEKDKAENGWAVEKRTNLVRPNETLEATLSVFDFNRADSNSPKNDVDGDGYLDIVFTISPQEDETSIMTSTYDYKSEVYKIKDK